MSKSYFFDFISFLFAINFQRKYYSLTEGRKKEIEHLKEEWAVYKCNLLMYFGAADKRNVNKY